MTKYICINYAIRNSKRVDTWWYNTELDFMLKQLEKDLEYFKLNNIKYNMYEVIEY